MLPEKLDQLPDIFVYLVRDDNRPICFKRLKPTKSDKPNELLGFEEPADWVLLQEGECAQKH